MVADSAAAAASSDLASAIAHLERLQRLGGEQAKALEAKLRASDLELADVAARGVLVAFEEVMPIIDELRLDAPPESTQELGRAGGNCALAVFDELVRRWEAHVPMGLLRALQDAASPRDEHLPSPCNIASIKELVARLQDRYQQWFLEQGLRIPYRCVAPR